MAGLVELVRYDDIIFEGKECVLQSSRELRCGYTLEPSGTTVVFYTTASIVRISSSP